MRPSTLPALDALGALMQRAQLWTADDRFPPPHCWFEACASLRSSPGVSQRLSSVGAVYGRVRWTRYFAAVRVEYDEVFFHPLAFDFRASLHHSPLLDGAEPPMPLSFFDPLSTLPIPVPRLTRGSIPRFVHVVAGYQRARLRSLADRRDAGDRSPPP